LQTMRNQVIFLQKKSWSEFAMNCHTH